MKNFLKSTAIFVCAALMMGACTEEDTEDIGSEYVPAPTIESLLPGNEKAVLTWYTPDTNEEVSKCQISWVGPNVKGATIQTISKLDSSQTYEITNEATPLAAGDYTISIKTLSTTGGESDVVEASVTIYDSSSYETPEVLSVEAVEDSVLLKWGEINADCDSIRVSYYDDYGIIYSVLVDEFDAESGVVTTLESAAFESQISYNAYFIPEGAAAGEYVIKAGTYTIVNVPDAPTNVVAKGGLNRFTLTWDVVMGAGDDFESLDYALITYGENSVMVSTTGESPLQEGTNSYTIENIEGGDYEVTIQLFNKAGFSSAADDDDADCNNVTVFDENSYDVPSIASAINVNGDITVSFNATDIDEACTVLALEYQCSSEEGDTKSVPVDLTADTTTSGVYTVVISDGFETSPITVSATFCPTGDYYLGDELVIEEVSEYTLPELAPEAPTSQTVTLDFNASSSWITVSWVLATTKNVDAVRVYYTSEDYVEITDLSTTSYVLSTAGGLIEVNKEYTIEVKTATDGGMVSEATDSFVAVPYNYSSHTNNDLPTPSVTTELNDANDGIIVISWADVHEDLKKTTVTYNSREYTFERDEDGTMVATEDILYATDQLSYTFTATFYPEGGLTENVVVNSTTYTFDMSDVKPTAPTNLTTSVGLTTAGGSKVTVTWDVEDASNVHEMYVFCNDGTTTDTLQYAETADIEVGTYTMVIEDLVTGTVDDPVTYSIYAQTYNSAVQSYSDSSDSQDGVSPYLASGYFSAPAIESVDYTDGVITILWGDTSYSGLTNVAVTYKAKDSNGNYSDVTLDIPVYTGKISSLVLPSAVPGTAITYVSTFLPTNAEDTVYVDSTESYLVPSAASSFSVQAGVEADGNLYSPVVRVKWSLEEVSSVYKMYVFYKDSSASDYTMVEVEIEAAGSSYEYVIPVGYSGRVYSAYVAVVQNDSAATQYNTAVETVTTYGSADYLNSVPPVVESFVLTDGVIDIVWSGYDGIADLHSISIMNGDDTFLMTLADDLYKGTTFNTLELDDPSQFTYNVNFIPEGGADFVVKSTDVILSLNATPSDPVYTTEFVSGYDEGGAYVKLFWDLDETDVFLYQTAIEFTVVGAAIPAYTVIIDEDDFASLEGDGYKVYVTDDLKVDTDYTAQVYNMSQGLVKSNVILDYSGIRLYNEATYSTVAPSVSFSFYVTEALPTWYNLHDDVTSLSVTYNGTTYDLEVVDGVVCSAGTTTEFTLSSVLVDGVTTFGYAISSCPSNGETVYTATGADLAMDVACGYVDGVYEIYTALGLSYFADVVNGTNGVTKVNTANGKLMADIDLSTVCSATLGSWTPIGTTYYGDFDGNGKTISNLYINATTSYQGVFGYIDGTILNLTVDSPQITSTNSINGSVVGRTTANAILQNCYVTGTGSISGTQSNGGLAGNCIGLVRNCHVGSGISVTGSGGATGNSAAGGLLGNAAGYIIGSSSSATVTGNRSHGGLLGYSGSATTIVGSSNLGEILSSSMGNQGGLAGRVIGTFTIQFIGCSNTGYVDSNGSDQAAGILGVTTSSVLLAGSYNTGDVNVGTKTSNVGALLAYANSTNTVDGNYFIPTTNMTSAWLATYATDALLAEMRVAADIAALNAGVSTMNSAIETYLSDVNTALSDAYGFTISCSYVDGGSGVPTMVVTYSDELN